MRDWIRLLLVPMMLALLAARAEADPVLRFAPKTGTFEVSYRTMPILSAAFVFWHDEWQWSGLTLSSIANGDFRYAVDGSNDKSALFVHAAVARPSEHALQWDIDLSDRSTFTRQWGGLSFRFDRLSLEKASGGTPEQPSMLEDGSGFALRMTPDGQPLTVRFEPPPGQLFFERKNPFEIRAYFNSDTEVLGDRKIRMIVTLPGDGNVEPTPDERVAAPDPDNWQAMDLDPLDLPVDLSFLNAPEKPAGKRGFLKSVDGGFVFPDGTPARFWGTTITAYALFQTTPENICRQARRLSKLGFNLVRIHHHDSAWVNPNIFGKDAKDTLTLDPQSLASIDQWVKCLKDEGIYVWLDMQAGRAFTALDGIEAFEEIAKGKPIIDARGFNYVNESIEKRMREFAAAYLSHVNPLTGLAYKDDPAVAFILLTNENDVTHHFGNAMLPDYKVPYHTERYLAQARQFALANNLDPDKTWRSWEDGPSKLFLNDLEHKFNHRMIGYLRGMGVQALIATTDQWGDNSMSSLPSLLDGDFTSVHSYQNPEYLSTNPNYQANIVSRVASSAILNTPLIVSEWNEEPFPAVDRAALPLYMASIGVMQGWNGLLHYAYAVAPTNGGRPVGNYEFNSDPAILAMTPASALIYRQGHISEKTPVVVAPSMNELMDHPLSADSAKAIRILAETAPMRVQIPQMPELPWLDSHTRGKSSKLPSETETTGLADKEICGPERHVCRDWKNGVLTVDTDKSQVLAGWIGNRTLRTRDVTASLSVAFSTIAVQSLDDEPVRRSNDILVSLAAQSLPDKTSPTGMTTELVQGDLSVCAKPGLSFFAVGSHGEKFKVLSRYEDGCYVVHLAKGVPTPWLRLSAE